MLLLTILLVAHFFSSVPEGAAIILGMVACFAGVTHAPITAFVIVMELTDNHEMILPLLAAVFIAKLRSRLVCPLPLFLTRVQNFINKPALLPKELGNSPGA